MPAEIRTDTSERAFELLVTASDAARASLTARGRLDASNAQLFVELIAGHLRDRRRFLRVDVAELLLADPAALAAIRQAHQLALQERGTLILLRVSDPLRRALARSGLDTELFMVPDTAHDWVGSAIK